MSLNVTSQGESGSCEGEADDLLESGVRVSVFGGSCFEYYWTCYYYGCPTKAFDFLVSPYVEHDIGNTSYGTFFAPNGPGSVSSKITVAPTIVWIYDTCGTWNINLQATKLNLSSVTTNPIALFLNDSDDSGPFCFDVNAQIGNGIAKSQQGLHRARH